LQDSSAFRNLRGDWGQRKRWPFLFLECSSAICSDEQLLTLQRIRLQDTCRNANGTMPPWQSNKKDVAAMAMNDQSMRVAIHDFFMAGPSLMLFSVRH
jgi:hypothetical protein